MTTQINPNRFIAHHGGNISNGYRRFRCTSLIGAGPSYARCSPIQPTEKDNVLTGANSTFIVRIVTISQNAECSVGIHSEVDQFFDREKSRNGFEFSVHGHHIECGLRSGRHFRRSVPTDTDDSDTYDSDSKSDTIMDHPESPEWTNGDIIKVYFDINSKKLNWWHNGIVQRTATDASCAAYAVEGGPERDDPRKYISNIKWCFYVRGVGMVVEIEDNDLSEEAYELLQNSYPQRLKKMEDEIEAECSEKGNTRENIKFFSQSHCSLL